MPVHHAGVVSVAGGRPSDTDHGLPKPIRRRRLPFFLWVDPRASAVRSSAPAGRERAPVTRATHLPLPAAKNGNMRRRWFVGGRDRTLSAATWAPRGPRRVEDGGAWTGVQEPQNASIGAPHARFVQNCVMNARQWRTHDGTKHGAGAVGGRWASKVMALLGRWGPCRIV